MKFDPKFQRGDIVSFPYGSSILKGKVMGFDNVQRKYSVFNGTHGYKVLNEFHLILIRKRESRITWRIAVGLGLIQKDF